MDVNDVYDARLGSVPVYRIPPNKGEHCGGNWMLVLNGVYVVDR
jgi:hypothetical protein